MKTLETAFMHWWKNASNPKISYSAAVKVSQSLNDALLTRLNGIYANPRALGQKELDLVFGARDDLPDDFTDQEGATWEKIIELSDKLPSRLRKGIESHVESYSALPNTWKAKLKLNGIYHKILSDNDTWLKNLLIKSMIGTSSRASSLKTKHDDLRITRDLWAKYLAKSTEETDIKKIFENIKENLSRGVFTESSVEFLRKKGIYYRNMPRDFKQKILEYISKNGLSNPFWSNLIHLNDDEHFYHLGLELDEETKRAIEQYVQKDAQINTATRFFIQEQLSAKPAFGNPNHGRTRVMKDWLMTLLKSIADDDQTSPKQNSSVALSPAPKGAWARRLFAYHSI